MMPILWILIPASILLGGTFLFLFLKSTDAGQFDDLETPALKPLLEEKTYDKP